MSLVRSRVGPILSHGDRDDRKHGAVAHYLDRGRVGSRIRPDAERRRHKPLATPREVRREWNPQIMRTLASRMSRHPPPRGDVPPPALTAPGAFS